MKITKEDVLKIEHEIICEDDDIWSLSDEISKKLEIEIKPLYVFDSYNSGLDSIREIQIIEEEDINNINYIKKLINRMERRVLGKILNQVNTMQAKLNYILNS